MLCHNLLCKYENQTDWDELKAKNQTDWMKKESLAMWLQASES